VVLFYKEHIVLDAYHAKVEERAKIGVVPKPLTVDEVAEVITLLQNPPKGSEDELISLLENRIPPGVDEAAKVKADFLTNIAVGALSSPLITPVRAVELLGTMQGGYNVASLINFLELEELAPVAAKALSHTLLIFDAFTDVAKLADSGNEYAKSVIKSWADAEWFTSKPKLADKITLTVFKVPGETNTDDLSPAPDAWSRPDIPLHAMAMLKNERPGIVPDENGVTGPVSTINALREKGYPLVYVGDVVGTGSSRKSATNSVLWFMGNDIPFVPNKRAGGFVFGGKIAPIFFNTMEDAGALPVELDVTAMNTGDIIDVYPYEGKVTSHDNKDAVLSTFSLKTQVLLDEVRAGGRIPLIIGRGLTAKARNYLGLPASEVFVKPMQAPDTGKGYTLAQKIVGRACGVDGVRPGSYCEPVMTTVGSQDTTGPMTRDELKDLACLSFSADLVMQSFCHTAAYPKPVDVVTHDTLPKFIEERGGVALRPGDGVIHSWLNRMVLPDTVGTGGDSHTRFPMGISFPAGSGLVAFAAATGVMPLDMPESVLVRFTGKIQPGITLRDLVHAIPLKAIEMGLLTVEKKGKKNIFSGRILEIQGLEDLKVEQAFELADASAERSAAGCTVALNKEPLIEYITSNISLLKWMIKEGYQSKDTLAKRIKAMEDWLANPELLRADADAEYAAVIEINMDDIKEPVLCAPNDPDDARTLSAVAGASIDEVFIGSCMTNIGHYRAAATILEKCKNQLPVKLWIAPPTKMDRAEIIHEGLYSIFGKVGTRCEIPGCSLCMGNQARVADNSTVISTSTRNFPNRLGQGANVYLASAELATVASVLGHIPTKEEYLEGVKVLSGKESSIYSYLKFNEMTDYNV
jgi:aconitate hydratase 2/2-methylisocitrate dehydratase